MVAAEPLTLAAAIQRVVAQVFTRVTVDSVLAPCDFLSAAGLARYSLVLRYEALEMSSLVLFDLIGRVDMVAYSLGVHG